MSRIRQASVGETIGHLTGSASRLAVIAAVGAVLAVVLPIVDISRGSVGAVGETGSDLSGVVAWFVAIAFMIAAAARFAPSLARFANILDGAALVLLAGATLWAFVGGPVVTEVRQASQALAAMGEMSPPPPGLAAENASMADALRDAAAIAVTPAPGALFLCLAPASLLAARCQERRRRIA